MLALEIQTRNAQESSDAVRARGLMPAVFYGPKEESMPIAIDAARFERVFKEAGETTVITLKGVGGDKDTLVHDVQFHPVTGKPLHADFYVIEKGKKVSVSIPLEFEGQAPAEKLGFIISKALHEVEIEVAPAELPKHLIVDITSLANDGDHITVGQIKLPPSAELVTDASEIVASVTEMKEEKEEAAPAAVPAEGAPAAEASEAAATPEKSE